MKIEPKLTPEELPKAHEAESESLLSREAKSFCLRSCRKRKLSDCGGALTTEQSKRQDRKTSPA